MDEALEVVDVVADAGLEGVVTWLLRLLWLPALLILVGIVLLVAPSVLLALAEFA